MRRLTFKYNGMRIGADIEEGGTIPGALRTIANAIERIEKGDYELVEDFDEDVETQTIDEFFNHIKEK